MPLMTIGSGRGLLPPRRVVNLLLQDSELDHTDWTKGNCTISANATTDPTLGPTADTIVENGATTTHRISQAITKPALTVSYNLNVRVKAASGSRRLVFVAGNGLDTSGAFCVFDVQGGQIGVASTVFGSGWTAGSASLATLGDGWFLCSLSRVISDADTTIRIAIGLDNQTGTNALSQSYTGDSASGLHVWKAELTQAV